MLSLLFDYIGLRPVNFKYDDIMREIGKCHGIAANAPKGVHNLIQMGHSLRYMLSERGTLAKTRLGVVAGHTDGRPLRDDGKRRRAKEYIFLGLLRVWLAAKKALQGLP